MFTLTQAKNIFDNFIHCKDLINKHEYTIFEYNDIYQNCIMCLQKQVSFLYQI